LSAVTVTDAPDIAVGDVLGSCVFNLMILALIDILYRKGNLYKEVGHGHLVSAGFGVILLAGAGLAVVLGAQGMMPALSHISITSVLLLGIYLVAMRTVYVIEQHHPSRADETEPTTMTLKAALMGYGMASMRDCGRRHLAAHHWRRTGSTDGLAPLLCWHPLHCLCHLGA
jgi:cation:H+ antiporter